MNGTSETARRSIGHPCSRCYSVYSVYSVVSIGYAHVPVRRCRDCSRSLIPSVPRGQSSPALATDEQAVVTYVDAHNAEALLLLERAVNINSGTGNHAGVREVGKLFADEFEALGFTTRWVDGTPFKRAGHLVAERARPGRRVLLIGHLDTVFEADSPFQKFERLSDRQARGPGIIDMKGGDVIIVQALKALRATGALDRMHVTVVMTGDEESAGEPQDAGARGADRRGEGRRGRHRVRGRRGRSQNRGHRPPRDDIVDADGDRQARALVANLSFRHRLRRDLRGCAHSQRVSRDAGRGAAPHVQSGARRRRHDR